MKYLKKRNLYNLVVEKLNYFDMPKCKYCDYRFHGGCEWLSFCLDDSTYVEVSAMAYGRWLHVRESDFYDNLKRDEVLSHI